MNTDGMRLAKVDAIADYRAVPSKPLIEVVQLGKRGEIVLPRRLRNHLGLREGDQLVLSVEERRIVLERRGRNLGAYLDVMASSSGAATGDD